MSKDIEKYVDKAVVGLNKAQDFTKAHSGNGRTKVFLFFTDA